MERCSRCLAHNQLGAMRNATLSSFVSPKFDFTLKSERRFLRLKDLKLITNQNCPVLMAAKFIGIEAEVK